MNIAYFLSQFPKVSESFILNEIHELCRRGHTVSVFSLKPSEEGIEHTELSEIDVQVEYLPSPSVHSAVATLPWSVQNGFEYYLKSGCTLKQAVGSAYIENHFDRFLSERDPDVVHSHFTNWPRLAALSAAHRSGIPLTVTAHAYGIFRDGTQPIEEILSLADRVLTISQFNRRYIADHFVDRSDIDVVRMGIREEKFSPGGDVTEGRILAVGRLVEKKGFHYAFEAISDLPAGAYQFHVVGSGPQKEDLVALSKELGVADNVEFLGRVSDQTLLAEYDAADVFLLPCVRDETGDMDGIPVTLMEAMAMKTIPVSSKLSGIPELIRDATNGYLAEPGDTGTVTAALRRAFTTDNREEVRRRARKTVLSSFTVEHTVDALLDSFRAVSSP